VTAGIFRGIKARPGAGFPALGPPSAPAAEIGNRQADVIDGERTRSQSRIRRRGAEPVRDAEARASDADLGSIVPAAMPNNLHLFQDMKRVLTDVDFGAEKKQNKAIREFLTARGYVPDNGVYMASEGSRHIYLHKDTKLNVDVFADELDFCHKVPFKGRLGFDSPTICNTDLLLEKCRSSRSI
jgi:hypothetical protein